MGEIVIKVCDFIWGYALQVPNYLVSQVTSFSPQDNDPVLNMILVALFSIVYFGVKTLFPNLTRILSREKAVSFNYEADVDSTADVEQGKKSEINIEEHKNKTAKKARQIDNKANRDAAIRQNYEMEERWADRERLKQAAYGKSDGRFLKPMPPGWQYHDQNFKTWEENEKNRRDR